MYIGCAVRWAIRSGSVSRAPATRCASTPTNSMPNASRPCSTLHEGAEGSDSGEPARAARLLRKALGLWRWDPFGDVANVPLLRAEGDRLTECRWRAWRSCMPPSWPAATPDDRVRTGRTGRTSPDAGTAVGPADDRAVPDGTAGQDPRGLPPHPRRPDRRARSGARGQAAESRRAAPRRGTLGPGHELPERLAAPVAGELRLPWEQARTLEHLGAAHEDADNREAAKTACRKARRLFVELGAPGTGARKRERRTRASVALRLRAARTVKVEETDRGGMDVGSGLRADRTRHPSLRGDLATLCTQGACSPRCSRCHL